MPRLRSERYVVQNPFRRYAEQAGWTYLSPEDALRLRHGDTSPILWDVFLDQVQRLNPGRVDHNEAEEIAKRLLRVPPTIEGNQRAWEFLRGLQTVFVQQELRERNLTLVDYADPSRDTYHVTDEFRFTDGTDSIRADIVLLLNGIPVIVIENKAAVRLDGIAESLDQLRRYHREAPELLALLQIYGLTHLVQFYYGATWNLSRKDLFNWRVESGAKQYEQLVKEFVAPERVLRVLSDFILFTRRDDELTKVVLRPHQMRAVDRALSRALDPAKRRGLIWHTQGSGKTFTMITIAKKLMETPAFQHPTVLMLVDRNELETQLFGNLAACGIENVRVADSKRELRDFIASDYRGLVVSLIHKFDDVPADLNTRENIFVLADEAHRSTGGDLGNYLMGALPNATYLGFTGTPIDRTAHGGGTFKVFGVDDPETGYLDKYSIAESVEDGTTVPLYYSLAPSELLPDREVLEREFLQQKDAEGVSDIEELNRILERAVTLRAMLKSPEHIAGVARHVADHYRNVVEPLGYKAFVVGVDREACVFYKKALDKLLPPEYSQVVISPGHNDQPHLSTQHISEEEEKRIRKAFLKRDQNPRILIVTEKLLTGFDAPVLYCMYLDKPMRDHVLLQAIARVNRPYEDAEGRRKPGGFVVDFVGIFERLEDALAFDSKDVQSVVAGLDELKARFAVLMGQGRAQYLPLAEGKVADKAAEAVLDHFMEEDPRQEFYRFFLELQDLYEIISPDPYLRPFLEEYQDLAAIYALLRSAFESDAVSIDRQLARKTEWLVGQHTRSSAIRDAVMVYEINAETLRKLAETQEDGRVKVFNLLKGVVQHVEKEMRRSPYLLSIGQRAEEIAERFLQRQLDTHEALKSVDALIEEINQASRQQVQRNMAADAFTVFWLLSQDGVDEAAAGQTARDLQPIFQRFPQWWTTQAHTRNVRRACYEAFSGLGLDDLPDFVDHVLTALRGRTA